MEQKKRERLFLDIIKKYTLLFWVCLAGFVISASSALAGYRPKTALALAALCLIGLLRAPLAAWVKRSKSGVPGLYEEEVHTRNPLAGDVSPDAPPAASSDQQVTLVPKPDDPEESQGSAPPQA
jgi:hypothetical protein